MLDIRMILTAVSADFPCGDDLEYDPDFLQLEREAQGKPERIMGDAIQPSEPPQWQRIQQSSINLLQRSKDLRIVHFLLQSALGLHGITGLANALTLISELLGQYWPTLHPQLDTDDDNDPTVRLNALSGIACETNVRLLRESLLTRSRTFGPISLRAALHASGLQSFSSEKLKPEELTAAFRDSESEHLLALRSSLLRAHSTADAIEHFVSGQPDCTEGVDLSALKQPLKQALQILDDYAPSHTSTESPASETSEIGTQDSTIARSGQGNPGNIFSRDEVVRSLDRILDYYARNEPSSPLPVLLKRARNLVQADFAAIVNNLIPDGLSQFENLRGPDGH